MKPVYKVLLAAIIIAACLSPLASSNPDGLERVAIDLGFMHRGEGEPLVQSPVPDYIFPGIENEKLATAAAGVTGTLVVFGAMYGLARVVRKNNH